MLKEHPIFILMPIAPALTFSPVVDQHLVATTDDEPIEDVDPIASNVDLVGPIVVMDIPLIGLQYQMTTLYDVGDVSYPTTYKEAIISPQSNFWINAMKDKMTSMS